MTCFLFVGKRPTAPPPLRRVLLLFFLASYCAAPVVVMVMLCYELFLHFIPSFSADDGLQSALFNFQSLLIVILLTICTCAYIRGQMPSLLDRNKTGCAKNVYFTSVFFLVWFRKEFNYNIITIH
jgi:hypothetical protein